ncbi:hypothetical protein ACXR2U_22815, partial [Jatrophihabitans sp. YIM 134969]
MAAKHRDRTGTAGGTRRTGTTGGGRWRVAALLLVSVLIGTGITVVAAAPSASAADRNATISLTGITSNTYPTGGNTVWVQPGTGLTITEAPISAGANQGLLGTVSGIVTGVLGALFKVVDLQATVDLSSVGKGTVSLGGGGQASVSTPALKKGVYPIAWSFKAIVVNKLTQAKTSVALNGNQLNRLGLKLNAKNQYVGYIVSDTKSPCGGAQCISLQTPRLSVAPSAPVVGQLPTVGVPGTTVNVPVPSVPGVNAPLPGQGGSGSGTPSSAPSSAATSKPTTRSTSGNGSLTNPYGYQAPGCTGPCLVVPQGGGSGGSVGGASDVTLSDLGDAAASGGGASADGGAGDAAAA